MWYRRLAASGFFDSEAAALNKLSPVKFPYHKDGDKSANIEQLPYEGKTLEEALNEIHSDSENPDSMLLNNAEKPTIFKGNTSAIRFKSFENGPGLVNDKPADRYSW
jgi:hypothetical protein